MFLCVYVMHVVMYMCVCVCLYTRVCNPCMCMHLCVMCVVHVCVCARMCVYIMYACVSV